MSSGYTQGEPMGAGASASEEELRAAYEAEIKKIRVEQILLEHVVTLINLGMRRTGLSPGTEDERDLEQVRVAIEAVRVLLPLIEQSAPAQAGPIRDALSQLQLAFVKLGGGSTPAGPTAADREASPQAPGAAPGGPGASSGPAGPSEPNPAAPDSGEPGPAQRSGRLWVPGQ